MQIIAIFLHFFKGAMAGLAFGMIFLGLLVGGVIYFLSFRFNLQLRCVLEIQLISTKK